MEFVKKNKEKFLKERLDIKREMEDVGAEHRSALKTVIPPCPQGGSQPQICRDAWPCVSTFLLLPQDVIILREKRG
jgi:hypothetical protein